MTVTLTPQEVRPPETAARLEDDPRHGPHRWTRADYRPLGSTDNRQLWPLCQELLPPHP